MFDAPQQPLDAPPSAAGDEFPLGRAIARATGSLAGPVIGLTLVLIVFGAWEPRTFLTPLAFGNVFNGYFEVAIAAVGATFVIIAGGIDLSVGSVIALSSVTCALALAGFTVPAFQWGQCGAISGGLSLLAALLTIGRMRQSGAGALRTGIVAGAVVTMTATISIVALRALCNRSFPPQPLPVALLVGVATGAVAGLLNGLMVTSLGLPPFLVTLASLKALRSVALCLTDGLPVNTGRLKFLASPNSGLFGLSPSVFVAMAVVLVGIPLLHLTVLGRYTFAIGSNERTARLCGVRVDLYKTLTYVLAGLTAGIAGTLRVGSFNGGLPTEFEGWELRVIAAVVLGGTSLFGGEGNMLGSAIGVLMLGFLAMGCAIAGISPNAQGLFIGGIILLAASLNRFRRMRQ